MQLSNIISCNRTSNINFIFYFKKANMCDLIYIQLYNLSSKEKRSRLFEKLGQSVTDPQGSISKPMPT